MVWCFGSCCLVALLHQNLIFTTQQMLICLMQLQLVTCKKCSGQSVEEEIRTGFIQRIKSHVAATLGNDALLKVLLDHELNVDARDKDGETPLHAASQGRSAGHLRCVEILLQSAGADVTVRNSAGLSPRDVAATTEIRSVLHNAESERARTGEL
eukprot:GGOE01002600.1.p1 GENE.GGOE01002600.1~~GGOE01002600.1.p1  ORF type:complete len:155 (-),score=14.14 GGOE01002600.1:18-482(-)